MPFFSTFSGSLSAGRRSKGVKNSPQSDGGSPKYPKDPRNVWFHLVANQAGEHRSDWRDIGDRDGTEIDIIEESTNGWSYFRDLRKGAAGVHAIEDLGPYRITDAIGSIVTHAGTSNEKTYTTKNLICSNGAGGSFNSSSTDARSNFTTNSTGTTSYRSGYNEVFINMAGFTSWDTGLGGGQSYRKPGTIQWKPDTSEGANPFIIYPGSDELNNGETIGEEVSGYMVGRVEARPFTLEFWMYMMNDYMPNQASLFTSGSGSASIKLLMTGTPKSMNMSSPNPTSVWTTVDNGDKFRNSTWHHIAITRDKHGHEGKLRSFIDGELIQYADCAGMDNQFMWNTDEFVFGDEDLSMALFDDVRFIVGECVYGSANSFTPPNKKFEQSAVTVECHSDRLKESTGNANDFEFKKVDDTVFFHASSRRLKSGHSQLSGSYAENHFMNLANTHSVDSRYDPRANTLAGWTPTYDANTQPKYDGTSATGSGWPLQWEHEWGSGWTPNTAMGETSVEDMVYVGEITPLYGATPAFLFQGERDKAVEIVRPGLAAGFRGIHDWTVELCWKKVGDYPTTQTGKHDWPILRFQLDAGGDTYSDNNDDSTYVELRSSTELLTSTNPVDADEPRFLTLANYPPTGAVGVVDDKVISSVGDHRGTETATGELSRYKWHHIAIVYQYEINTVSLYLDGFRTVKFGPTLGMGNWDWNDIEYLRYGWGCKIYELQMTAIAKYTGETYKLPDHPPFNGKKGIDYPISDEGIVFSHFNAYKEDNNRANTVWDHAKNRYMGDIISHEGDPDDPGGRGFLDKDFTARPRGSTPAPGSATYGDPDLYTDITAVTGDSHDPTIRYCFERTANVADGEVQTSNHEGAIQFTKVIPGFDLTSNTGTTTGSSLWGSSSQVGERPEGNTDDFPYDHYGPLMIDFWFVWKTDDATSSGPQDPFQDAYDFDGSTYIEVFSFGTAASNAASSESDRPFMDSTDRLRCEIQLWDTYDGRNVYSPKWKFTGLNQNGSVTNAGRAQKVESKTVAQEAAANSGAGIRDMHGNPFAPFRSELQPQEAEEGTWIYESIARFPYSEPHAGNTWFGVNQYGTSYTPNTYCNVETNKLYHIKMGLSSSGWEYFYVNGRLLEAHHIPMQAEKTSGQGWAKEWGKRVNSKGEFHWRGVPQTWSYDRAVYNISAWDQARILQGIDKGSMSDIRISSYDIDATQFYIPEDAELKRLPSRPSQSGLDKIAFDGALTQVGIDASKHPYSDASIPSFYGPTVSTFTYDSTEVEGTKSTDEGIDVVNEYDRILKFSPSAGITEPSSRVLVEFSNGSDHRFDIYEGYTLEAWIYPFDNTYTPGTNNLGYQVIIDTRPASPVGGFGQWNPILAFSGGTTGNYYERIYAGDGGAGSSPFTNTQDLRTGVTSVPYDQWTHVAFTCIGDSVKIPASAPDWYRMTKRIWINGVLGAEEITDGLTSLPTVGYLDYQYTNIGQPASAVSGEGYNDATNSLYKFKGYIQNARVSKGVKYLNSFTPPNLRDDMQWSRTTSP